MKAGIYPRCVSVTGAMGVRSPYAPITMPENTVEGDVMLWFISHKSAGWATLPDGWTLIVRDTCGSVRGEVYWKRAAADEAGPYAIDDVTNDYNCIISYANCAPGDPIDVFTSQENLGATGNTGTPGVTTTVDKAVIVIATAMASHNAYGNFSDWVAANIPGRFPELCDAGNLSQNSLGVAHSTMVSAGATGVTGNTSGSITDNVGLCVALKPNPTDPDLGCDDELVGAPANTTLQAAYEIESLPFTIIQSAAEGESPKEYWFKYTPSQVENAFGVYAWTNPAMAGIFEVMVEVYKNAGLDLVVGDYPPVIGTQRQWVVPTLQGETYYIKVIDISTAPPDQTGAEFRLYLYPAPRQGVAVGDLLVNDDTGANPIEVLDQDTGATKQLYNPFPAGECGAVLDNGYSLWSSHTLYEDSNYLYLYDPQMQLVAAIEGLVNADIISIWMPQIRGEHASKFYVLSSYFGQPSVELHTVTHEGVVGAQSWTLPVSGNVYMGVSPDETVLYYAKSGETTIHRWDLVNDEALANLPVTFPGTYKVDSANDLLTMSDGSLLVKVAAGGSPDLLLRIDPDDGTILNTYQFSNDTINRLALDVNDNTFWVWTYPYTATTSLCRSTFSKVQTSDGTILTTFTMWEVAAGAGYPMMTGPELVQEFGVSNSCPFIIAREAIGAAPEGTLDVTLEDLALAGAGTVTNSQYPVSQDVHPLNPYVMLQWSDDGGNTWSNEHWLPVGRVGEYTRRMKWTRLGRARDRVFRVAVSEPCKWILVDAWVDLEIGTGRR